MDNTCIIGPSGLYKGKQGNWLRNSSNFRLRLCVWILTRYHTPAVPKSGSHVNAYYCLHLCVYIHAYMQTCIHISCTYIYVYVCVCTYVHMHICMYVFVDTHVNVHNMYVYTPMHGRVCAYTWTYADTDVDTVLNHTIYCLVVCGFVYFAPYHTTGISLYLILCCVSIPYSNPFYSALLYCDIPGITVVCWTVLYCTIRR